MDLVILAVFAVVLFGAGFGFRGLIARELKAVVADFKTEVAKLRTDLTAVEAKAKAEVKTVEGDVKAEAKKL
jgi:hypothetical protein